MLLASKRDTIRGNASETVLGVDKAKSGICSMYIYIYIYMYGLYVCPLNARAGTGFFS